jgi:translocation and assembly module TamB
MGRAIRWLAWALAGLVGFVVLLLGLVIVVGNTGPGQILLARLVPRVTGGQITLTGLSGRFPDALRVATLELRDKAGAYLSFHDVALDWSPLQLAHATLDIDRLTVARAELTRQPEPSSSSGSSGSLPVRIVLHTLRVGRFELAPSLTGHAMAVALDGSGALASYSAGQGELTVRDLGAPGTYHLDAQVDASRLHLTLTANEPPHGLIASVAGLPDLGGIAIDARLDGPRDAVATNVTVTAGPLSAKAQGSLDLVHSAADVTVAAQAPAMQPRPDLSWHSVVLNARAHGPFTRPDVSGQVTIDQLDAAGSGVQRLVADVSGNQGLVHVEATVDGLRLPGPQPELMAGAPLKLVATAHLQEPNRPVEFSLQHPLLSAQGSAETEGAPRARVHLVIPQLAPFAAVAGADLRGHTTLDIGTAVQNGTTDLTVAGTIGLDAGPSQAVAVVGNDTHLDLAVGLHGQDVSLSHFALTGQDAAASAHGQIAGGVVNLDWSMSLAKLAAVQPTLQGNVEAKGHVGGSTQDLSVVADLNGNVAAQGVGSGAVSAHLQAQGLPGAPNGQLTAQGTLLGGPIELAVAAQRLPDGAFHVAIDRANWKSAHAEGALTIALPSVVPTGQLRFVMTRLADLAPLIGKPIAGSAEASLEATSTAANLTASARDVTVPGTASVSRLTLKLAVANPTTHPVADGNLSVDGFAAGGINGSATLRAQGPQDGLALTLAARLPDFSGAAASITTSARLDLPQRSLALASLQAGWKQREIRLLGPARIDFANGVAINGLRLAVDRGVLTMDGAVGNRLNLNATLRDLPASIITIVSPTMAAEGTISAEAHVTGTTARPDGTLRLAANGVRLRSGPGQAIPAANLTANATLGGGQARLDARLTAGSSNLSLTGTAPISGNGALDLRATGAVDLTMANPLLTASGRRAAGRLTMDATITGVVSAPRVVGTVQLANGDVQDYTLGLHLRAIGATVQADGENIRLVRFTATAGPGTLEGSGTIGLAAPMPVNLTFTAHNAMPIANDIITERLDANLTVAGDAQGNLAVRGTVSVLHADIQIPEKLPPSVAVLPIRDPNAPPAPPAHPAPPPEIALDLTLNAREVFIRGRGLTADLAGTTHAGGTTARPQATGGLTLQHGWFSLAGQSLTFTSGSIDFIGAGIANPALNFVATTTSNNITATLTIGGTVRKPTITLSSVPVLPQDEILAQILFHSSVGSLSPFQVAEIAAALASFSGATSADPLSNLRKSLGLDVFSVGSNATGSPTVQGGRYVAPGIYLGAQQSANGGTQATLQIDIAKGLKLNTTAGTGGNSTTGAAGASNGSSIGITYQFEY